MKFFDMRNTRARCCGLLLACTILLLTLSGIASGQNNPVPLINQPLVPDSAAPGTPGLTVVVNGSGFVSGSLVNWNGSPRQTKFVNSSRLMATIPASDLAVASGATITVVNPAPGGGVSNGGPFEVTTSTASVSFFSEPPIITAGASPLSACQGDFDRDGKPDMAVVLPGAVDVYRGNGDGTFLLGGAYPTGGNSFSIATGDFNGDGQPDLVTADFDEGKVSVLLGDGNGAFQTPALFTAGSDSIFVTAADFNQDGSLDLAVANAGGGTGNSGNVSVLLGNGDGTFQPAKLFDAGATPFALTAGDFNGDGKLDLAVAKVVSNAISILLGNGDGTFQSHVDYPTGIGPVSVATADLNGDKILDLAIANQNDSTVSVLLGNGDGTFQAQVNYATATSPSSLAVADFNSDNKLDIVVSTFCENPSSCSSGAASVLLGNGDGTFQAHRDSAAGQNTQFAVVADFNADGRPDIAVTNNLSPGAVLVLLQSTVAVAPSALSFASQDVGTTSQPQVVTLTNTSSTALNISGMSFTGTNSGDFTQTNDCGTSVAPGASCSISITFSPTFSGARSAFLNISDDGPASPQIVTLSGTGVAPAVTFNPGSISFQGIWLVGSRSNPGVATITNTGSATLNISSITVSSSEFQVLAHQCPPSLAPGALCAMQVFFKPKAPGVRTGAVLVTDNAPGSPQMLLLSGTATLFSVSPMSLDFGNQQVGTTSDPETVTVTNIGQATQKFDHKIYLQGGNVGQFAQTNNCGPTLAGGASCAISVTFKPLGSGFKGSTLEIVGSGATQSVSVTGTGVK